MSKLPRPAVQGNICTSVCPPRFIITTQVPPTVWQFLPQAFPFSSRPYGALPNTAPNIHKWISLSNKMYASSRVAYSSQNMASLALPIQISNMSPKYGIQPPPWRKTAITALYTHFKVLTRSCLLCPVHISITSHAAGGSVRHQCDAIK